MRSNYILGFIAACNARGVPYAELVKSAQDASLPRTVSRIWRRPRRISAYPDGRLVTTEYPEAPVRTAPASGTGPAPGSTPPRRPAGNYEEVAYPSGESVMRPLPVDFSKPMPYGGVHLERLAQTWDPARPPSKDYQILMIEKAIREGKVPQELAENIRATAYRADNPLEALNGIASDMRVNMPAAKTPSGAAARPSDASVNTVLNDAFTKAIAPDGGGSRYIRVDPDGLEFPNVNPSSYTDFQRFMQGIAKNNPNANNIESALTLQSLLPPGTSAGSTLPGQPASVNFQTMFGENNLGSALVDEIAGRYQGRVPNPNIRRAGWVAAGAGAGAGAAALGKKIVDSVDYQRKYDKNMDLIDGYGYVDSTLSPYDGDGPAPAPVTSRAGNVIINS